MIRRYTIIYIFVLIYLAGIPCNAKDRTEITPSRAVEIALDIAKEKRVVIKGKNIEIVRVKRGLERGPVRLSWLLRYFPYSHRKNVLENEFWIVYFYPKGQLNEPRTAGILDGEFCVLIELYSGVILDSFKFP